MLSLNLNKLDRRVFAWNAISSEQDGSWFLIQLLTEAEKTVLCGGLQFALLPKTLEYQIIWFLLNYFTKTSKLPT